MKIKLLVKHYIDGLLIAVQFFTVIPVNKQIPLDPPRLKKAIQLYPLIGLVFGSFLSLVIAIGQQWTSMSSISIALFVLTISVIFSGGLHLDGWMDASDAFFSYRDKDKRLEIMDDPRTGSFAVLSLIFLLAWRFLFMFETISQATVGYSLLLILLIPFFARLAMVLVFYFTNLAKGSGLAAFFKKALAARDVVFHAGSLVGLLIGIAAIDASLLIRVVILFGATLFFALICKSFIERQFGGITGDTLGATVEGTETGLWLTVWLLL